MMNEISKKKKDLRNKLTKKRNLIKRNTTLEFNIDAFHKLTEKIKFNAVDCVGSFMPIRSEISTNQLNAKILDMKKKLAFPTIEKNSETLIFKIANSLKSFKLGKFNIPEPNDNNKEIQRLDKKIEEQKMYGEIKQSRIISSDKVRVSSITEYYIYIGLIVVFLLIQISLLVF